MNMGARIRSERARQGISQQKLAKLANVSGDYPQSVISRLETRDSRWSEYAADIARALGVTLDWLISGAEPKHPLSTSDLELYELLQSMPNSSKAAIRTLLQSTSHKAN